MKSITTLSFIIAFLLSPALIFGQKHYQSGYIITLKNDTIAGRVKDRKPQPFGKLYKKIRFRGNNTIRRKYSADQIAGYIDKIDLFKRMGEPSFVRVTQGILGLKKKRLSKYFEDCPELVYKIENKELKDPVEIVNFYNSRNQ